MFTNRPDLISTIFSVIFISFSTFSQDPGCGDFWYDSGGEFASYMNNERDTITFCPENIGEAVTLTFGYVDIETTQGFGSQEGCWDYLEIFNGPDIDSPSLGVFCGEGDGDGGIASNPDALLSVGDAFTGTGESGCLTVVFFSDGSVQETGWEASVSCGPAPNCIPPEFSIETSRDCENLAFDAVVTIESPTIPNALPLLVVTAEVNGTPLFGQTVPNVAGATVEFIGIPLDVNVGFSVNTIGVLCPTFEFLEVTSNGCSIPVDCGNQIEKSYCYGDNDSTLFIYVNEANEPLTLYFLEGLIEECCDEVFIYDGIDSSSPLLFSGNNGGDLADVLVTASSGSIFMQLDTDLSVNCQSGSLSASQWHWTVQCASGIIPCDIAVPIPSTATLTESIAALDISEGSASGELQCLNPNSPQTDRWFSFESVTTNMCVAAKGLNDFDAVVEVYDACGGQLLNCQNNKSAGERELVIVENTIPGETYYFRVYHAGSSAPVQQDFFVAVAYAPFAEIIPEDCNFLDYTEESILTAALLVDASYIDSWSFEFTELEPPFNTYEIISPNGADPQFLLEWFPQAEAGRNYTVRARGGLYNGSLWCDYGEACVIGFSSFQEVGRFGDNGSEIGLSPIEVSVSPNPNDGKELLVSVSQLPRADENLTIGIFDLFGREVRSGVLIQTGTEAVVRISDINLPPGIYLVGISANGKRVGTQKQIIK